MARFVKTKNRGPSRVANAQLDEQKVRLIRQALSEGASAQAIAEVYDVGAETIRRIGRRESWAWVTDGPVLQHVDTITPASEIPLPAETPEMQARAKASLAKFLKMREEDEKQG